MKSRLANFVEKNGWECGVSPPIFFCFGTRCIFFHNFLIKRIVLMHFIWNEKDHWVNSIFGDGKIYDVQNKGYIVWNPTWLNGMSINRLLLKKLAHWPIAFFLLKEDIHMDKKMHIWKKVNYFENHEPASLSRVTR